MGNINLSLPTIQNWSCHNCGGCCKQHAILVTPEEQKRIENQKWEQQPDFALTGSLFVKHGGTRAKPQYRVAHREDGACLFLDEKGLCKIHAKFGEDAKPLACRIYPYAFHPKGDQVAVSLRFSCPSVIENKGKSLTENENVILKYAREVVPKQFQKTPPPLLSRKESVSWKELLLFVDSFASIIESSEEPFVIRLLKAIRWIQQIESSTFKKLSPEQIKEYLQLVTPFLTVVEKNNDLLENKPKPKRWARLYLRLLAGQYARKDKFSLIDAGLSGRWNLLKSAGKLSAGIGTLPQLHEQLKPVPFANLEQSFGKIPEEAEEILTRYFSVKIRSLHFCGSAYYDIPFIEGAYSLITIVPVFFYIARWIAAGEKRDTLTSDDIQQAIALADHQHGYSPIFGSRSFRTRIRQLASHQQIEQLLLHYTQ